MKIFAKILAIVLAVLTLSSLMVACGGNNEQETEAATISDKKITLTVIVKSATGKEVYKQEFQCPENKATLGEALEIFSAYIDYTGDDYTLFDNNGILTQLGDVKPGEGQIFIAYDETKGKDEAFKTIKDQPVTDGQTIVVQVVKN